METAKGLLLMEEEAASKKYVLEEKDNKVVISKDNVAKVFAMMANSPQYKRAANIKKENSSSSYWFDQWKDRELSEDELIKLLTLLNAENSTHISKEDTLVSLGSDSDVKFPCICFPVLTVLCSLFSAQCNYINNYAPKTVRYFLYYYHNSSVGIKGENKYAWIIMGLERSRI